MAPRPTLYEFAQLDVSLLCHTAREAGSLPYKGWAIIGANISYFASYISYLFAFGQILSPGSFFQNS